MINSSHGRERQVLPRWRSVKDATAVGEMNAARKEFPNAHWLTTVERANGQIDAAFRKSRELWQRTVDLAAAEELLTAALTTHCEDDPEVLAAATKVARAPQTRGAMRAYAERIIRGLQEDQAVALPRQRAAVITGIRERKHLLRINPRDGLLVAETALLHANIGQQRKARELLERAIRTAPNSRYVLRAAVRFFCHDGDPERALETIRKSRRLYFDPWLRSAELATGSLLGESPRDWRKAKAMVDGGEFSNHAISELAAQLGTIELSAGSKRQALRILRKGAQCPTENAVAQIEHVGRETAIFTPEELIADLSTSHEATAHAAYWKFEWDKALSACERWFEIEPFSTRPAIFASFIASVRSTSLERGLALGLSALEANPGEPTLLNNVAVIHAYRGELEEARSVLAKVKIGVDSDSKATNLATSGLISIRSGDIECGVQEYTNAVALALKDKRHVTALRAYCFLGRELSRVDRDFAKLFGDSVDKTMDRLRMAGHSIPRDVIVLRSQFDTSEIMDFDSLSQLPLRAMPDLDLSES